MNRRRWWMENRVWFAVAVVGTLSCTAGMSPGLAFEPVRLAQVSTAKPVVSTGGANSAGPTAAAPIAGSPPGSAVSVPAPTAPEVGTFGYSYDPSGRRDPFAAVILQGQTPGEEDLNLPPLQRVGITELSLMGIVWGGFGYNAMVQTPDGKGYTVRVGTRIGPNNGVVSGITENSVIVQERFTDVYGKQQVREYVKRLHEKESSE